MANLIKIVSHQQDVCHDGPVEVEGHLAEEDEGESHEDVGAGKEEGREDEEGRKNKSGSADYRIGPGKLFSQKSAE